MFKAGLSTELETSLIKHYSANGVFTDYGKVGGQAVPKHSVIDFGRSSGRGVKKDGYYLFTADEGIETPVSLSIN